MASKPRKLTCTFFVGSKPVEKLTSEQLAKMSRALGETMSTYYAAHPDEYLKLKIGNTSN